MVVGNAVNKKTGICFCPQGIHGLLRSERPDERHLVPPSIWNIQAIGDGSTAQVTVDVTDLSNVIRVGVTYTLGDGTWTTIDLTQNISNPNQWTGTIPNDETVEWFVQAVDGAGNVAINDNKGAYFGSIDFRIWLPIIRFCEAE
jgi:hypothetical protein